jgi:hypothetical protein
LRIEHEATDRLGAPWPRAGAGTSSSSPRRSPSAPRRRGDHRHRRQARARGPEPRDRREPGVEHDEHRPPTAGAGLYEFPIYNPTRETIYLSIDVSRTTNGRYATTFYNNKWIYRDVTTNYDCGAVGTAGDWEPDYDRPNCAVAAATWHARLAVE